EQLKMHDQAAQKMKNYRQKLGSLSLETIEAKTIIKNRIVIDIIEEKKNRAKDIIENLMIAANRASTKFLHAHAFPAFKRVVRVPKRWDKIVEIAVKLGKNLPDEPDSKALELFLIEEKKRDPVQFPDLSLSIIKLLGRGEYVVEYPGEDAPGHFGLAIRNYSHSTAPNRRYPDLITQRMLRAILENQENPYSKKELERLAERCTLKEADADKVARQMQKSAGAILLSQKIGQTFDGIITGVTKDGTWLRIFNPPVDGKLIKGKTDLDVGDHVKVKLVSTDVQRGFIDFSLVTGQS
ncbi:MAG TPA: RNB domain-containing ribonuclease, partial [Parachlamydiaceae bacterium]|nr:RNB domain-containing ribonuclease [Parachlamydiaceae bacterium]